MTWEICKRLALNPVIWIVCVAVLLWLVFMLSAARRAAKDVRRRALWRCPRCAGPFGMEAAQQSMRELVDSEPPMVLIRCQKCGPMMFSEEGEPGGAFPGK